MKHILIPLFLLVTSIANPSATAAAKPMLAEMLAELKQLKETD